MFTKQKCYVLFSFYNFFQKMIFIPINFTFVCYIQFTKGRFFTFCSILCFGVCLCFLIISAGGDTGVRELFFDFFY